MLEKGIPQLTIFEGRINYAISTIADGNMSEPYSPQQEVRANRHAFLEANGVCFDKTVWMNPVHLDHIAFVEPTDKPFVMEGYKNIAPGFDSLYTTRAKNQKNNKALGVTPGDCPIVVITDNEASVLAEVHAGRRGSELGVVSKTIAQLVRTGIKPEDLIAGIFPSICSACYEMPYLETINPEMWKRFIRLTEAENLFEVPSLSSTGEQKFDINGNPLKRIYPQNYSGGIQIDVQSFIHSQMVTAGLRPENIEVSNVCTFESAEKGILPSHYYSDTRLLGRNQSRFAVVAQLAS